MKRIISSVLIFLVIIITACPIKATELRYVNADILSVTMSIDSSGVASVMVKMTGNTSSAQVSVSTYIEKKIGVAWTRVDIGTTNDVWVCNTTNASLMKTYTARLVGTGEYRAVAEFILIGSTVEEVIKISEVTY